MNKKRNNHEGLLLMGAFAVGLFLIQFITSFLPRGLILYAFASIMAGYVLATKIENKVKKILSTTMFAVVGGIAFITSVLKTALNPALYALIYAVPKSTSIQQVLLDPKYWLFTLGYGFVVTAALLSVGLIIRFLVSKK